jgi:putative spermidine/putrescine transport system substrate-binding protein
VEFRPFNLWEINMSITRRTILKSAAAVSVGAAFVGKASAQSRDMHIGMYNSALGKWIQKEILPRFEKENNCKVHTVEGATLANIAALRATRSTPKFSMMAMDDVGIPQAKDEELIEKLDPAKIPNLAKLMKRYLFEGGYGAGFSISSASMFAQPKIAEGVKSYADLFDPKFAKSILLNTPKNTQSVLMLIAVASVATGKPFKEAQYLIDDPRTWEKLKALKPNILTIYDGEALTLQVAQEGGPKVGGIEYSKSIYPHAVKGLPLTMLDMKEGTFTGINCVTLVKNAPAPDLGNALINKILDPAVQKEMAEFSLSAPSVSGLSFKPDVEKYLAYPEEKVDKMGLFTPDWRYIIPKRPAWLEKYNQMLTS